MNQTESGPGANPERRDYNDITDLEHATKLYHREKRRVKGLAKTCAILKHNISTLQAKMKNLVPETGLEEAKAELEKFRQLYKKKADKLSTSALRAVGMNAVVKKLERKANVWRK